MSVISDYDEENRMLVDQSQYNYYTLGNINDYISNCPNNNLNIFHVNIRSFDSNYGEISDFLDSFIRRSNIIVFSETWFSEVTCKEIDFTGYHVYR